MPQITFLDTEIDSKAKILDIGCVRHDDAIFHSNSIEKLIRFLDGSEFLCGHNIIDHDLKHLRKTSYEQKFDVFKPIDTLYLSPLLFPHKPYHKLLKDDKLLTEELNNPVNDSKKARELFYDEINAFQRLDESIKKIYFSLLEDASHFRFFFEYIEYQSEYLSDQVLQSVIQKVLLGKICLNANVRAFIENYPIELAYSISFLIADNRDSITPPWVLKNYPEVDRFMHLLRANPCLQGCEYCDSALDPKKNLRKFFGYDSFRTYEGKSLQEDAVKAAIDNKSILTIFPTGGGKSLTFQLPALIAGETSRGLTVVISPLQSLMKDQVDNLEEIGITDAVTINGLLDPIERSISIKRVENGSASILYISPELLRSKTLEKLLIGRKIVRFVIDEAHCFSSWGHDFRVDYLYIADFIRNLQELKNLSDKIPVSCFTATAKLKVIEDICAYFEEKLSLKLQIFKSDTSRKNLHYKVIPGLDDEQKYSRLRSLVEENDCPSIIYVSRTKKASELADRLTQDGYNASPYHGKMEKAEKSHNQNAFKEGEIQIMVATSAFGMGVDKKDVGMVIHYDISDSLENYVQEAGRAGRDENITADCYVLYDENDINKHFTLFNQSKLSIKEVQQIWRAIKDLDKFKKGLSNSALEIARKAGWDENINDIETRVTTAISALEQSGYLKRIHNSPRIFATSILAKNADEAIAKINNSSNFKEEEKEKGIRIIKKLISTRSKAHPNEEIPESRVDHIADHLGIEGKEVIRILTLLREAKVLADDKDMSAYIHKEGNKNQSSNILKSYAQIENLLLSKIENEGQVYNLKEFNEAISEAGVSGVNPNKIKILFNFWAIRNWIKRKYEDHARNHISIHFKIPKEELSRKFQLRHELSRFVIDYLYQKFQEDQQENKESDVVLIEFSVLDLKEQYEQSNKIFKSKISTKDIEDTLFYLSRIEAIKIEGSFMVVYNRLNISRIEQNNKVQYKTEDYQTLQIFYTNKVQQIHIVAEYAKKMIEDYKSALKFVDDYFTLNYSSFLRIYFPGSKKDELNRTISPAKFKKMFGTLSPRQLEIIKDNESKNIVVAAGPGSGKTMVLVHKLASLLLMEDVKSDQLLMLTFSRAATSEFKLRLIELVGKAAHYIDIKTFHSFCFDLLGRVGNIEKSDAIIRTTVEKIRSGEVERAKITKTVLVIDEAQDINKDEYDLINSLMEVNEEMRVIAVGDDDQNVYTFRGADSKFLSDFIYKEQATKYELIDNYRAKNNLVEFSNLFVKIIPNRLKEMPIRAVSKENGEIRLIKYNCDEMIVPLVEDVSAARLKGTTGVLTNTNDEAMQVAGLLGHRKIKARLIQKEEGFRLSDLEEFRFFLDYFEDNKTSKKVSDELWDDAIENLVEKFEGSKNIEVCLSLIDRFGKEYMNGKYLSDLRSYISESEFGDFVKNGDETIIVSTIHKAKGKEFDTVFLLMNKFDIHHDDKKRQLYVAMTRARTNLNIHHNDSFLALDFNSDVIFKEDDIQYAAPENLHIQLNHHDVNLGYFKYTQGKINDLKCGDHLELDEEGCLDNENFHVLKFSKKFKEQLQHHDSKGYKPSSANLNFKVYWKLKEEDLEILILLPEITLKRRPQ